MTSTIVTIESGGLSCLQKMCRLCMREEYLEDVFKENSLNQWIANYLSITITSEDRKGHTICTVCRLRLFDFHQFWTRCQEVQGILQSMVRDEDETPARLEEPQIVKAESCQQVAEQDEREQNTSTEIPSRDVSDRGNYGIQSNSLELQSDASEHGVESFAGNYNGEQETEQSPGLDDEIEIQEVKIETLPDDGEPLDQESLKVRKVQSFQCNACKKVCRNESQLRVHKRRIHGPRNHHCSVCELSFPFRFAVQRHIPRHDPNYIREKTYDGSNYAGGPFRCDICHKEYGLRSTLRSHVTQVHGPKRFPCHLCDWKFPTRHALGRHIRSHYRENENV